MSIQTLLLRVEKGFTLIELMVTVAIVAILLAVAVPDLGGWIRSADVNATAESLQNGLRRAQVEAVTRNVRVDFSLVAVKPSASNFTVAAAPAQANAQNWVVRTDEGADSKFLQAFVASDVSTQVIVTGAASVFFAGFGKAQQSNGSPIAANLIYRISRPGTSRVMCVFVTPGAAIKMCDPSKASGNPVACQPQVSATACAPGV